MPGFVGCVGKPSNVGDLDALPTARELSFNIVKLNEAVAYKLLGFKKKKVGDSIVWEKVNKGRVTLDESDPMIVCIDGEPMYHRFKGGKGISR